MMETTIHSLEDMKIIAERLAAISKPNDVYLLKGDLGAGKTTFSQFFGYGLGVKKTINSPTFNIIKSYHGRLPFHHMDCYRLEDGEEDLGFDDYFYGDGVTLVEWPEMIRDFLPEDYLTIEIAYLSEHERKLKITAHGSRYEQRLEEFDETASY